MKKNVVFSRLLSLVLVVSLFALPSTLRAAEREMPAEQAEMNIVETAIAAGSFETLVAAVTAADLGGALSGEGPFTVFAPTDDAFAALPAGTIDALLADPSGDLTQILLYHVLSGKVMAEAVTDGLEVETLQGSTVKFSIVDGQPMINDAMIVTTDIEASNGVIHVIDAVIMPPVEAAAAMPAMSEMPEMNIVETAIAAGSFETLVAAVTAADLGGALSGEGPFTVFAPTDDAFAALPEGTIDALLADPSGDLTQILLYHVLSGKVMAEAVTDGLEVETLQGSTVKFSIVDGQPMINDAMIVTTDIEASNGVIHVIDAVIMPPVDAAAAMPAMSEMPAMNIVETAIAAGSFETLVAAVTAADLGGALSGEGPFTVFAPTDDAFAALPAGTIDALLADPSGDLTQILLYHVLSGKVMAEAVTDGLEVETLQGSTVKFSIVDGKPMINDAMIVTTDIEASNGVIHVIDAVIMPPAEDAAPDMLPVTGGEMVESSSGLPTWIFIVLAAVVLGGFVWYRRTATHSA